MYVYVFPVAPSVIDATATLDTPNENRLLHSITVKCVIHPDSTADMCEVMIIANGQTLTDNEYEYIRIHIIYLNTIQELGLHNWYNLRSTLQLLYTYTKSKIFNFSFDCIQTTSGFVSDIIHTVYNNMD